MRKLALSIILGSLTLGVTLSPASASAVPSSYELVALGDLFGGAVVSRAYALNDNGAVVGSSESALGFQPFVWDAEGGMRVLGGGAAAGAAFDINNHGAVVGRTHGAVVGSTPNQPFFFQEATGFLGLDIGDQLAGRAWAINDSGLIVGSTGGIGVGVPLSAVVWSSFEASRQSLATGSALGVNDVGQVVGEIAEPGLHPITYRSGFLWDGTTGFLDLGGSSNQAWAVNDAGTVVGDTGSGEFFAWSAEAGFVEIADALGTAKAINNSGVAVGGGDGYGYGFVWDAVSGVVALNALLGESGQGWNVWNATDINENGWISGYGTSPEGHIEALLLIPVPEPSTALLMGLGLAGLATIRRR